ncbi:Anhydro-N-acetylmuramic acid kinase [Lamellibrachia satsuma]|nr:Anhydro-N-acetylmuramic acid kinase [Lamellibrachia satsuma]
MASYIGIGVMSGSSLDGVDICCVEFTGDVLTDIWSHRIIKATTVSYPPSWIEKLRNASNYSGLDLVKLNVDYGHYVGKLVQSFINERKLKVNFVAAHGHTIFHQPQHGFTFQIGDGETMATHLFCPLVVNFRNKDVALSGQGAPLVPAGERYLFNDYDLCLNLGGIANVSICERGFDVSPCNMLLNHLAQQHDSSMEYDADGLLARRGSVRVDLLAELDALPFYEHRPPKSLGREWFDENVLPILARRKDVGTEDQLRTCTEHVARQTARAIDRELKPAGCVLNGVSAGHEQPLSLLLTGGGAMNVFLVERLQEALKECHVDVNVTEIDADTINFKEAIVFSFLGLRCLLGLVNVRRDTTGATRDSVSGSIHLPPGGVPLSCPAMQEYRFHLSRSGVASEEVYRIYPRSNSIC